MPKLIWRKLYAALSGLWHDRYAYLLWWGWIVFTHAVAIRVAFVAGGIVIIFYSLRDGEWYFTVMGCDVICAAIYFNPDKLVEMPDTARLQLFAPPNPGQNARSTGRGIAKHQ